jgi:hypothetical protein
MNIKYKYLPQINNLQILSIIFNYLKIETTLRCSLVCKRWFDVINKNIRFMRTVLCKVPMVEYEVPTVMRTYRAYRFKEYGHWCFNFSFLSSAEHIEFVECCFVNLYQLKTVLDACVNATKFKLHKISFTYPPHAVIREDSNHFCQTDLKSKKVRCEIGLTCLRALDCFTRLSQVVVKEQADQSSTEYLENITFLLTNYPSVITSLHLNLATEEVLRLLANSKSLQLQSLTIKNDYINAEALQEFFTKQQTYITSLIIKRALTQDVLEVTCHHLHNLENFECELSKNQSVNLNSLQTIKRLQSLRLDIKESNELLDLDIGKLSLKELTIFGNQGELLFLRSFNNSSRKIMPCIKKLIIWNVNVERKAFYQIIEFMPNLEYLCIDSYVSWPFITVFGYQF